MSDTKSILKYVRDRLNDGPNITFGKPTVKDLVDALEQAEAQLAAALQVNATRQAEVTADVLNAMMAGITGQKESVRVEVDGFQCPYCNEISKTIEAATAHDAICPKHPAVIRAEKAEAERKNTDVQFSQVSLDNTLLRTQVMTAEANVARLTKMVATLFQWCSQFESWHTLEEIGLALANGMACPEPWQYTEEAARRAVAAGEEPCQK